VSWYLFINNEVRMIKKINIILHKPIVPVIFSFIFFVLYSILGVVRHNHYGSFGADLGFIDEVFWRYSQFDYSKLLGGNHLEFTSLFLAPIYWIWADPRILIILQAFLISFSGIAVFLLAKRRKLNIYLCYSILFSYLTFYGVQSALWFDVHTSVFAASFLTWFLYFLDNNNKKASIVVFFLAIFSKENMAAYVFLLCITYFIATRKKSALVFAGICVAYAYLLFYIIFPATLPTGYGYSSNQGLLSGNPLQMIDTQIKQRTLFYTFAWVGFVPLTAPWLLIPALGNLASYFILGREYVAAHEIYMHYRVDLAPLLAFATIFTIVKYRRLNSKYIAIYLLVCSLFFQYSLHLPLSYLSKTWFWTRPSGVNAINKLKEELPENASLAAQNNIYPHVSQRDEISLLWPDTRFFKDNSPCDKSLCPWFRWEGSPEYIIVDLSPEWDIRHLLHQNSEYKQAVESMEKYGVIKKYKQEQTAIIYKVMTKAK